MCEVLFDLAHCTCVNYARKEEMSRRAICNNADTYYCNKVLTINLTQNLIQKIQKLMKKYLFISIGVIRRLDTL